jgi:DNA-binding NarL/FixJ family response regulator
VNATSAPRTARAVDQHGRSRRTGATVPARVVVADDSVLREGIVRLLQQPGLDVVGQAGEAAELVRRVAAQKPDVALVDIRMPPMGTDDGLRAAREIGRRYPDTAVVVLSQYVEHDHALELPSDAPRGVGYLLKDRVVDIERFAEAVIRVAAGGSALDPEVLGEVAHRARRDDPLAVLGPASARCSS